MLYEVITVLRKSNASITDSSVETENGVFYFPITTCIVSYNFV